MAKKEERVPSGIHNFDLLIDGGFKRNSVNLLIGGAGSGKTIFSIQYLMKGLRDGEKCLYLTFEEKKTKLYDDMKDFRWNLEDYEKKHRFYYLEYNPEQVKSLLEEGGGTVDQLISKKKITRLVIDSITSFSLLYQDELARKESALALFDLINRWGCTALLTSQELSKQNEHDSTSLEFEADSIILLYHSKLKGRRIRGIEILKMRGTSHTDKTMALDITDKGIVIHPQKVIKFN